MQNKVGRNINVFFENCVCKYLSPLLPYIRIFRIHYQCKPQLMPLYIFIHKTFIISPAKWPGSGKWTLPYIISASLNRCHYIIIRKSFIYFSREVAGQWQIDSAIYIYTSACVYAHMCVHKEMIYTCV